MLPEVEGIQEKRLLAPGPAPKSRPPSSKEAQVGTTTWA